MESIVFIVAHPDDVADGMGGTAWLLKDKYKLHVLCGTKGDKGVPGQDEAKTAAIREKEEGAACKLLNAELTFLGQADREIYAGREICQQVADIIKEIKPKAIFTTWPVDRHPDHAAISEITTKAIRLAGLDPELYYCEEGKRTQTMHFDPDLYIDITPVIKEKLKLIRCHVCQNTDDRMAQHFLKQAQERGKEAGCDYAEGFKLVDANLLEEKYLLKIWAFKRKR
jgi:LmbE family N-acetylglucosaminyl deacetylase